MTWTSTLGCVLVLAGGQGKVDLDRLRDQIIPAQKAAWETIPWLTDLAEARRVAARAGKLIFVWAMNGHPCGAT